MEKKKLRLEELQVKSFITTSDGINEETPQIKGGTAWVFSNVGESFKVYGEGAEHSFQYMSNKLLDPPLKPTPPKPPIPIKGPIGIISKGAKVGSALSWAVMSVIDSYDAINGGDPYGGGKISEAVSNWWFGN